MSQATIEQKVQDYLRKSELLQQEWQKPITPEQLQAEMDRMAQHTKQPEVLREVFEALGNNPFVIAECLARPVLAEQMTTGLHVTQSKTELSRPNVVAAATANYTLPKVSGGCTDDTWTPTSIPNAPDGRRNHTAVWTGSEMIVWGGYDGFTDLDTGGRYNPSTNSWTVTNTANAPDGRTGHIAVWTGTEMIVWGGLTCCPLVYFNTGGRYNPVTDNWVATTTTAAPDGRTAETAVWTGTEMIVWGGSGTRVYNTGSKYNPDTDSWTATSTSALSARYAHAAVWTGSEMIVWGGSDGFTRFDTGGRYNPVTNTWLATNTTGAPSSRYVHTAVWTGSEMIVWGGLDFSGFLNTGGRYDPFTDSWTTTSTTDAPSARDGHTAIWTGSEMIVWGGYDAPNDLNTGGRYNPFTDSWTATTTTDVPAERESHSVVWTGSEMIVWGGYGGMYLDTGGRYCAQAGSPTPTATGTPTPTVTPTATPTATPGRIVLKAHEQMFNHRLVVHLRWTGATTPTVDIYRNGVRIARVQNAGSYSDTLTEHGIYTYQVCEARTGNCSNEVTVRFGGP
jgi:N-acetylneuraminic acid mutarotase